MASNRSRTDSMDTNKVGSARKLNPSSSGHTQQPKGRGDGKKHGSTTKPPASRLSKPSDRLNPKTVDPFSRSRPVSAFADIYNSGGIPCRLMHGSVKHKLSWEKDPNTIMSFDPLLVSLTDGLQESIHPYAFVAREGFKELLMTPTAKQKIDPVLPKIISPLKTALCHSNSAVFAASMKCLVILSHCAGPALTPHLKNLLSPLSKRSLDKSLREDVMTVLTELEQDGGKEAYLVIKAKIPTYSSSTYY